MIFPEKIVQASQTGSLQTVLISLWLLDSKVSVANQKNRNCWIISVKPVNISFLRWAETGSRKRKILLARKQAPCFSLGPRRADIVSYH
jgi:hypothetical protein